MKRGTVKKQSVGSKRSAAKTSGWKPRRSV
jgi:hypothetical protein